MKTTKIALLGAAAAFLFTGSSLMAHGRCRHHDDSLLEEIGHATRRVIHEIARPHCPPPPCRPGYGHGHGYGHVRRQQMIARQEMIRDQQELMALRAREAQLQREIMWEQQQMRRGCGYAGVIGSQGVYAYSRGVVRPAVVATPAYGPTGYPVYQTSYRY